MESEDDPVIKEIPVFLSKSLVSNLVLCQYPVRPCTLPYDPNTTQVLESKFKPQQQKLELTMGLNTSCANYDNSKGEQIALNVDGSGRKTAEDELTFTQGVMDKMSLTSNVAVSDSSR